MGFAYCGGLGIGAGELLGALMQFFPFGIGATRMAARGMERLSDAVSGKRKIKNIYAGPTLFPRWLYIKIANAGWNSAARANGIRPEDLYRRL